MKIIARNKKAYFDYQVLDTWEAGLVLLGSEIKAIRANRVNITSSYIKPFTTNDNTELWWLGSHFTLDNDDQTRTKKILLNSSEIKKIIGKLSSGNYTIVPLELYLSRGIAKLKIALASRKNKKDKRKTIKKHDIERDLGQEVGRRR